MHDDQIRGLLRRLEDDREPDPAFADELFERVLLLARPAPRRLPFVLLAAAMLLVALAAGLVVGSGLVDLPVPSAEPTAPSDSASPAPSDGTAAETGSILFAAADGLQIRSEPRSSGDIVATLRAGQLMGVLDGPRETDGMTWYEVAIGPGTLQGWIANGPDGDWLRLVTDGAVAFWCHSCASAPVLARVSPFGPATVTILSSDDRNSSDWSWSPDGTRLAGTDFDGNSHSVAVMSADGTDRRVLGDGTSPRWSPDGTRLAWERPWANEDVIVVTDVNLVPAPLGLGTLRPAPWVPPPDSDVLWSPDGTRLAIAALDCPACPTDEPLVPTSLYTVDVTDGNQRQLTGATAQDSVTSWAPDGSRLVLVRRDLSGGLPPRAMLISAEGGEPTTLLEDNGLVGPTWSPDGARMALFTAADGLVVLDGDGTNPRVVAPLGDSVIRELHWSPTGRYLLFSTSGPLEDVAADLWIVPADGSAVPTRLTEDNWGSASWQPILVPLR